VRVPSAGIVSPCRSKVAEKTVWPVVIGTVDSTICSNMPTQL
jgi:hypothetical protein